MLSRQPYSQVPYPAILSPGHPHPRSLSSVIIHTTTPLVPSPAVLLPRQPLPQKMILFVIEKNINIKTYFLYKLFSGNRFLGFSSTLLYQYTCTCIMKHLKIDSMNTLCRNLFPFVPCYLRVFSMGCEDIHLLFPKIILHAVYTSKCRRQTTKTSCSIETTCFGFFFNFIWKYTLYVTFHKSKCGSY